MLELEIGWAQSIGKRDYQQDGVAKMIWPNGFALAVLSDGMGGAVHGEIASQEILKGFTDSFCASDEDNLEVRLNDSVLATNDHIARYIDAQPQCHGMGGTLVATAFTGEHVYWASVGDSPLWLLRGDQITRINQDHSKKAELQQLVAAGMMAEEDIAVHPQRNQLTSAVMGFAIESIDINHVTLAADDMLLIASDGVETILEADLLTLCQTLAIDHSVQAIAEQIIAFVEHLDRAHQDNATVMVLKFSQPPAAETEQGTAA
jgi:serine/threonine protein phosphatase PrpC